MGVVYDELFISTMKEINVCKGAIRRLSGTLNDMERKYNLTTAEFMDKYDSGKMEDGRDFKEWHDSFIGLKSWQQRLKEFEEILGNAKR